MEPNEKRSHSLAENKAMDSRQSEGLSWEANPKMEKNISLIWQQKFS